jgi:hypothetical protein
VCRDKQHYGTDIFFGMFFLISVEGIRMVKRNLKTVFVFVRWRRLFDSVACCVARVVLWDVKQMEHIEGLKLMTKQNK